MHTITFYVQSYNKPFIICGFETFDIAIACLKAQRQGMEDLGYIIEKIVIE